MELKQLSTWKENVKKICFFISSEQNTKHITHEQKGNAYATHSPTLQGFYQKLHWGDSHRPYM